jgi:hypothetical protein
MAGLAGEAWRCGVDETPDHEPVDTRRFPSSWRLTFRYDEEGTVELAGREEVPMVAPGSPGLIRSDGGDYSGSWVELQDQQGRVLFDFVLHDPFRRLLAVHYPPGPANQVVPGPPRRGEFTVVVPVMPEATTVVVWSSPLELERRGEAAREVGRFPLPSGSRGTMDQ